MRPLWLFLLAIMTANYALAADQHEPLAIQKQLNKAALALSEEDYETAKAIYWPLAESGIAEAQAIRGMMHEYGLGTLNDLNTACSWYSKASDNKYSDAMPAFADCIQKGYPSSHSPYEVLQEAAKLGSPLAFQALANAHLKGKLGLPKDQKKALYWLDKMIQSGKPEAYIYKALLQFPRGSRKQIDMLKKAVDLGAYSGWLILWELKQLDDTQKLNPDFVQCTHKQMLGEIPNTIKCDQKFDIFD